MATIRDLVPAWIGKPIFRRLNALLGHVRTAQSAAIPKVELTEEHLRGTEVVPDRRTFLERLPKSGRIAEVGVASGDLSAMILDVSRPSELWLIDCWESARYSAGQARVRERFAGPLASGQVRIEVGLSTEVLPRLPEKYFDLIYIDTDHSYLTTKRELELAASRVKPGGTIAGHDYVTGNWNGGVRYGVVEAVHEFCVVHRWRLVLLTSETDRHLSFAIRAI